MWSHSTGNSAVLKLETSSVLEVSTIKHSLLQSFVFVALFIDRNVKKPWKLFCPVATVLSIFYDGLVQCLNFLTLIC